MVREAIEASWALDPNNTLLTCIGGKLPHPQPYVGEPDIEQFKVFVAGVLRWLSMNLMLGSGRMNTLVQLRYLGTCLKGNALEWYSREVEHYTRSTHGWTLESTLIGLQDQFLDPLTWRHVSMQFGTAKQGSGTVKDLLNWLTKFMA